MVPVNGLVRLCMLAWTLVCGGCSIALAGGQVADGTGPARAHTRLQLDTTRVRSSGPVAGWALGMGHSEAQPVHIHNLRGRLGYGWQPPTRRVSARAVYEIGIGQPIDRDYSGNGLMVGLYGDVGVRLTGSRERAVNHYYLLRGDLDLFVALHAGLWSPPRGDSGHEVIEWGCLFGLRFEASSDVLSNTRDR